MAKVRKIPQRMCVGCREMKNKRELLRVVRTPEGNIEVDPTGKRAGRGAYLCPDPECLHQAVKGKRLQKALEQEISTEILDIIRAQLKP
jgi:predicted RNA-binding protein YlxR (DUF448 family)